MANRKRDFESSLMELKKESSILRENFTYLQEALNHADKELNYLNEVYKKENNRRKTIDYEAEIDSLQTFNNGVFELYSSVCDENLSLYKEIEGLKRQLEDLEVSREFEKEKKKEKEKSCQEENELYRFRIGEKMVEWNRNKYKITDVDVDNGRIKFREV